MPPLSIYEASTIETLIQRCSSITSLRIARQLHALLLTSSTPITAQTPFLYNNILSMYSRCRSLLDAQLVFDKMPHRSLVTFNALISAYSRAPPHCSPFAFKLLARMRSEGFGPDGATLTGLLQACTSLEDGNIGSALHTQVVKLGFLNNTCVETCLLGMYSNCRDLESAEKAFRCIENKDAVAWNSMVLGNMKNEKTREGLHVLGSMFRSGVVPTQFTYSMILNACSRLAAHTFGKLIHAHVIVSTRLADLPLQNALLDMYRNCGDTQTAFRIFSRIKDPDIVSWNSMIAGYSGNGDGEKAINLFNQLRYTSLAKPDEYTFAATVSAIRDFPASTYGKPLHAQVGKEGFESCVFVGSTLVSMYFRNGEIDSAEKLFSSIPQKDVVLWTEMIAGYSRMTDGESAIKFYYQMSLEGHKIDGFILSAALNACADLATMRQGEMIHSQALKTGHHVEMSVCGSLIDMYAKNGSLQNAQSIFTAVAEPDLKCWNSILGGYCHHGKTNEALRLFNEIQNQGFTPDSVTFLSLLAACSHCGWVNKGRFLWNYMKEIGLIPGPKHYCCMVSLLSRAGLLEEAEEMIIKSPFGEDYLDLWRTLLSSCVVKRNVAVGLNAAEQVLKLEAEDSATHILVSNLYAADGRWEGAAEMRRKIRGLMLEKDPGLSWVEVSKSVHAFSSGDQSYPRVDEVEAELEGLRANMVRTESDLMRDIFFYDAI